MTIKKNTLIIILSISLITCVIAYFINNQNKANALFTKMDNNIINNNKVDKSIDINESQDLINQSRDDSSIILNKQDKINNHIVRENSEKPSLVDNAEEEVINYFKSLELETLENSKESKFDKVKDKISNIFFTTIDFIFYGKEIKGVTFNELSDEAKIEILKIATNIDNIIIKKFPNYKETIQDKGNSVYIFTREQIIKLQNNIKNKIGNDKYNNIIDNIENGKNKIIDVKDDIFSNIKNWYENKRDN